MMSKFKRWLQHIVHILIQPRQFFSKIVADGNLEESMLKAFMYGLLGGIAVLALQLIGGATITFAAVFPGNNSSCVGCCFIVPIIGVMMMVSEITGGGTIESASGSHSIFIYPVILVLNSLA